MTTKESRNKTELALLIILGVLILFSGVQAYELTTLKSDIAKAEIGPGTASSGSSSTGTSSQVQRLQDLPQMVGGC